MNHPRKHKKVSGMHNLDIRKDESGKSDRKVTSTFDYVFYYILYVSGKFYHQESILLLTSLLLHQHPKIHRSLGRTDIMLEDTADHRIFFI